MRGSRERTPQRRAPSRSGSTPTPCGLARPSGPIRVLVDAAPPVAQLDHWLDQRRRHAELADRGRAVDAGTAAAKAAAIEPLRAAATAERPTVRGMSSQLRAGAAGFVHAARRRASRVRCASTRCTSCRSTTSMLPPTGARGGDEGGDGRGRRVGRGRAGRPRRGRPAGRRAAGVEALAADLAAVATEAELRTQRDAAAGRPGAAPHRGRTARRAAEAAATPTARRRRRGRARRRGPGRGRRRGAPVAGVDAARPAGGRRVGRARPPAARRPGAGAGRGAGSSRAARDAASEDLVRAEAAHERAMVRQQAAEAAQRTAIDQLRTARDSRGGARAPPVSGDRLGGVVADARCSGPRR